jgi:hypothetical protein
MSQRAPNDELAGGRIKAPETGLGRFDHYPGSSAGFRGHHKAVKWQLIGILCGMSSPVGPVLDEGAGYG